ncbi:hypothetical protein [Longispora albida]|uniref:hypothetical protein n=1 Tax=Longispora albida TaxID=203523 RepID=UPI000369FF5B|nr:hypothetical protein [Longispora albida]
MRKPLAVLAATAAIGAAMLAPAAPAAAGTGACGGTVHYMIGKGANFVWADAYVMCDGEVERPAKNYLYRRNANGTLTQVATGTGAIYHYCTTYAVNTYAVPDGQELTTWCG